MTESYYRSGDDYEYEYDEEYYDRRGKRYDDDKDKHCKDKDKDKDKSEKTFAKEVEKYINKKVGIACGKHVLVIVIVEVSKNYYIKAVEVGIGEIIVFQTPCVCFVEIAN